MRRERRVISVALLALALAVSAISGVAQDHSGEVVVGLALGLVGSAALVGLSIYLARKWERRNQADAHQHRRARLLGAIVLTVIAGYTALTVIGALAR
jgi:MFS family permease